MTALAVLLRDAVHAKLTTDRTGFTIVVPANKIIKTYFPQEDLENLETDPRICVVAEAWDESRIYRNATLVNRSHRVKIGVQQKVDMNNLETQMDNLVGLVQDIYGSLQTDTLTVDGRTVTWQATEAEKDENGFPYDFGNLRQAHTFEAYFNVTYLRPSG